MIVQPRSSSTIVELQISSRYSILLHQSQPPLLYWCSYPQSKVVVVVNHNKPRIYHRKRQIDNCSKVKDNKLSIE